MADGARFVVGIDLGTTHTVVAYAPIDPRRTRSAPEPRIFSIPQLTSLTELESLNLLPSALYSPVVGEIEGNPDWVTGEVARRRGAEVAGRSILSAKSWLSHAAVDRTAPILPWGSHDVPKLSPVEASSRLLAHLVTAWDAAHPSEPLAQQDVVLTLPASFDDVARQLTIQAAQDAGLAPTLLEEPTAAFYDAMRDVDAVREHVVPRNAAEERTVLVCDVGGGTTDLSLMAIAYAPKDKGGFTVRRVAVGRHILLGGDNMDLTLAHLAESRISPHSPLEPGELAQLVVACREAKERVLSSNGVDAATVTLLGRGSSLIGGSRGTTLTRADVERVVLAGFFPADVTAKVVPRARGGIVAFGLPYERDPAVTRHIRQFLARHSASPDVVLLNGGVFNSPLIVQTLKAALQTWSGGAPPAMLPVSDPDLAVACGAVRYGFARRGLGVRVESGAAFGYYVAVDSGEGKRGVCILPRGATEGVRYSAEGRTFDLVVGRTVRFDLYASDIAKDEVGALVTLDDFDRLPPVVANLDATHKSEASVRVKLGGELRTTGQLDLACVEVEGGRRFRLEFALRDGAPKPALSIAPASLAPPSLPPRLSPKLEEAGAILDKVFGKKIRCFRTRRERRSSRPRKGDWRSSVVDDGDVPLSRGPPAPESWRAPAHREPRARVLAAPRLLPPSWLWRSR